MPLPTLSSHWPCLRIGTPERQMVRQREQEARRLHELQTHSQYFKEQHVRSSKQAAWSSQRSYQQSMWVFQKEQQKEEKHRSLEERREKLRKMLLEENARLEAELKATCRDRSATEELRSACEERRKKSRSLQQEEDSLLTQLLELELLEEERRRDEEQRKKSEFRMVLSRQYRAQLKKRALQIQEELEADRRILEALMEGEDEEKRMQSGRREREQMWPG